MLTTCPFGEAVRRNPQLVCDLHLGLCRGVAEAVGGLEVMGLRPADPDVAGCRVDVHERPEPVRRRRRRTDAG